MAFGREKGGGSVVRMISSRRQDVGVGGRGLVRVKVETCKMVAGNTCAHVESTLYSLQYSSTAAPCLPHVDRDARKV
jgi:hypothetical protein